jgi:hypothetical protein
LLGPQPRFYLPRRPETGMSFIALGFENQEHLGDNPNPEWVILRFIHLVRGDPFRLYLRFPGTMLPDAPWLSILLQVCQHISV